MSYAARMRRVIFGLCGVAIGCGSDPAAPDAAAGDDALGGPCALPALTLSVTTLAGCRDAGTDDGPRGRAKFSNPTAVAIGSGGVVYIADHDSDRIRVVDAAGETATLVARPEFRAPGGLAIGPGNALYAMTDANDRGANTGDSGTIWRIDRATGAATVIARDLGQPRGLAVLGDGRIVLVDPLHHALAILDPATGAVAPLAGARDQPGHANGSGGDARFSRPADVVVLPDGDLAVTDQDNHRVRRVTLAGVVSDLAGTGAAGNIDGPLAVATFDAPQALALAPSGALYVTDIKRYFIRRIAGGAVTTVAGDGSRGWVDSDAPRAAKFGGLEGMDADAAQLVISDGNRGDGSDHHHVRLVDLTFL